MTDQDESRPLSRREIRLREMAAAGVAPEETPAPQEAAAAGDTATEQKGNWFNNAAELTPDAFVQLAEDDFGFLLDQDIGFITDP